jgi:hypothetical protein
MPQKGISAPWLVADRESTSGSVAVTPRELGEDGQCGDSSGKNRPLRMTRLKQLGRKLVWILQLNGKKKSFHFSTLFLKRAYA